MKVFIIINGTEATFIERETLRLAIDSAQHVCDFSKEVIVREVTSADLGSVVREKLIAYDSYLREFKPLVIGTSETEVDHYLKHYQS